MTIERDQIRGCYRISDIVGSIYLQQTYYGYTKREAIKAFRQYRREQTT